MKIYDDVLDKQFLDYINYNIPLMEWEIHSSTTNQQTPLFFNSIVVNENVKKEEYLFLFNIFVSIFGSDHPWSWEDPTEYKRNDLQMKEITLERGYVNLYPFGIGGDWHTDSDSKNGRTILFYPSDWKEEYGGATEFKSGEKVEYKKNRLLVFDGTKPHRAVIHNNPKNRYTIAFKINIGYK